MRFLRRLRRSVPDTEITFHYQYKMVHHRTVLIPVNEKKGLLCKYAVLVSGMRVEVLAHELAEIDLSRHEPLGFGICIATRRALEQIKTKERDPSLGRLLQNVLTGIKSGEYEKSFKPRWDD